MLFFFQKEKKAKTPVKFRGKHFFLFQKEKKTKPEENKIRRKENQEEKKTKSAAKFHGEQIDAHFEASANTLYGRSQTKRN